MRYLRWVEGQISCPIVDFNITQGVAQHASPDFSRLLTAIVAIAGHFPTKLEVSGGGGKRPFQSKPEISFRAAIVFS
jgi:hypothetical protein